MTVRGAADQRIVGRVIGGRFSARIVSPAGEQMREYLASEGAVLVDAGVVHHHYFLARRAEAGARRIPIIIPRLNRQVTGTVEEAGRESVQVGGRTVRRRFAIAWPAGGQLWVDDQGRVLASRCPNAGSRPCGPAPDEPRPGRGARKSTAGESVARRAGAVGMRRDAGNAFRTRRV